MINSLAERIIANAEVNKDNEFYSVTDGYDYNLSREDEDDAWYIQVCPSEQGFIYDGWWSGSEGESIKDAIKEAIKGAMILEEVKP